MAALFSYDKECKTHLEKGMQVARGWLSPTAKLDAVCLQVPSANWQQEVDTFRAFADAIIDMVYEGEHQIYMMLHDPETIEHYKLRKVVLVEKKELTQNRWGSIYFFDPEFAKFAVGKEVQSSGTMQAVVLNSDEASIIVTSDLTAESRKHHEYLTSLEEARLRVLADFQNYKRRTESERQEFMTMASKQILISLIEIIDDYNRALDQDASLPTEERVHGLERIFEKLGLVLKSQGLDEIVIKPGDKFDPTKMEAIGTVPVGEKEKDNSVIHIDQKGYVNTHKDTVYRTAKVIIGKHKV